MAGLATVISRILGDIDRGQEYSARVRVAIVDAVEFHKSTRLGFNQTRAEATLPADEQYIAVPDDWLDSDSLRIVDGDHIDPLREQTVDWINDHDRNPSYRSVPRWYALEGRALRFYPVPDQDYQLLLSYHCTIEGISASASDSTSTPWLNEGLTMIQYHAMADVLENYIGGEESAQQAARAMARAMAAKDELKRRANREQAGSGLRPWM